MKSMIILFEHQSVYLVKREAYLVRTALCVPRYEIRDTRNEPNA